MVWLYQLKSSLAKAGTSADVDTPQFHSYCVSVKNITLSVDDQVYRAARVEAAKRNRSLSAVVRAYLRAFARGKAPLLDKSGDDKDRKARQKLAKLLSECKLDLGYRPSRDKTYEGGRFSRF